MLRRWFAWSVVAGAAALALLVNVPTGNRGQSPPEAHDGQATAPFDFYVLALSWSPAFCATQAGQRSARQCGPDADFGFVTHGLWPQFEQGWPSFCQSPHGDTVPGAVAQTLLPIMPDRGLIAHQWDKHGTCTGLDQAGYAQRTLEATASITIPDLFLTQPSSRMDARAIERAFQESNPSVPGDGIAISCPGGRFAEVRICLDQDLNPRTCEAVDRQGCRQSGVLVTSR